MIEAILGSLNLSKPTPVICICIYLSSLFELRAKFIINQQMKSLNPSLNLILQQRILVCPDCMTSTTMIEEDKFGGILFLNVKEDKNKG